MQFLEGRFNASSETTIGVEFGSKTVEVNDYKIKMQVWDTVGVAWLRQDRKYSSQ